MDFGLNFEASRRRGSRRRCSWRTSNTKRSNCIRGSSKDDDADEELLGAAGRHGGVRSGDAGILVDAVHALGLPGFGVCHSDPEMTHSVEQPSHVDVEQLEGRTSGRLRSSNAKKRRRRRWPSSSATWVLRSLGPCQGRFRMPTKAVLRRRATCASWNQAIAPSFACNLAPHPRNVVRVAGEDHAWSFFPSVDAPPPGRGVSV
mmetsp:Transcript_9704/g.58844  ORF Transcript_9704/g.58844 Transcript_9704/m.58844 type:complete len:203 (-) Transcript_9704:69-677(-)